MLVAEMLAKKEWEPSAWLTSVLEVHGGIVTTEISIEPLDTKVLVLGSWVPTVGDRILVVATNVGYVCVGKVRN